MSSAMDLTKGLLIGAVAGVSIGLLAGSDKHKRQRLMRAAKKTVDAMEDTMKDAVDFVK